MPSQLRQVHESATLLLNEQQQNMVREGKEVFRFGFGESPFPPIARATETLREKAGAKSYSPVQGILELRERIAAFHGQVEGISVAPSRVLVAPGSKILLYTAMAAYTKADVLVPAPAWVSYRPQAAILGHHAIPVLTTAAQRWRVTPEGIEQAVRQKSDTTTPTLLILNYPGNPDGMTYTEAELKALAESFRKHRILVISDEIYGLLHHNGQHKSLALYYPEGTIVTGGLSKWCGAGGWRLGMAILPEALDGDYKRTMLAIASETYSCASLPVQYAACQAYINDTTTQDYLSHQRRILSLAGNAMAETLQKAGVTVHKPEGGFYLFLDFSPFVQAFRAKGMMTSQLLCQRLLAEAGVAILPGDAFGMESGHLSARLAYVDFDGVAALAASEKQGLGTPLGESFLAAQLEKNMRGITRLCEWVKQNTATAPLAKAV